MSDPSRYLIPRARAHALLWLMPVVFAGLAGAALVSLEGSSDRLHRLADKNVTLERIRSDGAAPVPKPKPAEAERLRHWTEMHADRDFPWARVFQAVEGADRNTIELLEFRPDKRNRRIVLRGEAKDRDALVAYIQALSEQPGLEQVHLLHMQGKLREKLETVEFEIKASMR
jgi:hypothetical protein